MSLLSDALATTKKIFLVSEELDRLSEDVRELARAVADHEGRLIRIETMIEMTQRIPKLSRKS
ncbi:MAG TPA: hypothetical protein VN612_06515 [Acidobacteriaceae bacterium]|nr:hypothetical protein [Acidobacteriaceae bacterium]